MRAIPALLCVLLSTPLFVAPAARAQAPQAAPALRFAPPADLPLRYRIEARRSWRGGDVPPIAGTTRYDIELRFAPPQADGSRRMRWQLLAVTQEGLAPAGAGGAPGAPDAANAVAEQLKALPLEVDLYASGAIRGLANWDAVAAAFDRAAAMLAAAEPPPPADDRANGQAMRRDAVPSAVSPASALDMLGAVAATDLLLRDLAPLLGWGGLAVDGAPLRDFTRLRLDGLGAGAIARRERTIARQADGRFEARMDLRPVAGALGDTLRAASRTAPRSEPTAENARPPSEIRRLAEAELSETVRAVLDAESGLPIEAVITRVTRAPGLFDQIETVTVARQP